MRNLPPELGPDAVGVLDRRTFLFSNATGDVPVGSIGGLVPLSQLRSAFPVLSRRKNRTGPVSLIQRQFRYGFGNAISREESDELHRRWTIPGPGRPLFEVASAKKDPSSPAQVDTARGDRDRCSSGRTRITPSRVPSPARRTASTPTRRR
ncbi:hypothetical protein F8271_02140 [Micromonospora sp. ALFpr18c]|uniref:hypothetical protein n=1 Tax=unclassified Micromonospora TaxID=2617518 RepID=UPI00124B7B5E|nr:hypothetical protein [Micromonospora sp. ALFpr18c]KAB1948553.1 hypothetical protein F8271_02140 [Micromonospora sp. ALFpr18c]